MFILVLALLTTAVQASSSVPISVRGADEKSFTPDLISLPLEKESTLYDVIVVGGGLSGLTSALYLTDRHKRVLLLEKESELGGLAFGGSLGNGVQYDRGAAYWTDAYPEELKILKRIGMGDYQDRYAIHEPIDSYYWNEKLYVGIWEKDTLEKLPATFALFKYELQKATAEGFAPNQPLEESDHQSLDHYSAAEWIRQMPGRVLLRAFEGDADARAIYDRFLADPVAQSPDPMGNVIGLINLYSRSALGATSDQVSALAFANFYCSELETRYTTVIGTGHAAEKLTEHLERSGLATIRTSAAVGRITQAHHRVTVQYLKDGRNHEVKARYLVFAAQLNIAPKIIDGLANTQQGSLMSALGYSHYSVHSVRVNGHPYRATYDTWVRRSDYKDSDFTDIILGRWMDPLIQGYEGMRDFFKNPVDRNGNPDNDGILTIYHPLTPDWIGKGYTEDQARELARGAIDRMIDGFSKMPEGYVQGPIDMVSAETTRWPFSVHIPKPGHFSNRAKVMRRRFGRIHFAHSNLGTPAFEEALFRGHCAANHILKRIDPTFKMEKWSACPRD